MVSRRVSLVSGANVLRTLLFAALLPGFFIGCGKDPEHHALSAQRIDAGLAAARSLPPPTQFEPLTFEQAQDLVRSCDTLRVLAPEDHDRLCAEPCGRLVKALVEGARRRTASRDQNHP